MEAGSVSRGEFKRSGSLLALFPALAHTVTLALLFHLDGKNGQRERGREREEESERGPLIRINFAA